MDFQNDYIHQKNNSDVRFLNGEGFPLAIFVSSLYTSTELLDSQEMT